MHVNTIYVENFRSVERLLLTDLQSGVIFLIGCNASGKSNLVTALRAIKTSIVGGSSVMSEDVRMPWNGEPSKLSIQVTLDANDLLNCSLDTSRVLNDMAVAAKIRYMPAGTTVELSTEYRPGMPGQAAIQSRSILVADPAGKELDATGHLKVQIENQVATYVAQRIWPLGPIRMPTSTVSANAQREMTYEARDLGNALYRIVAAQTPEYDELLKDLNDVFPLLDKPVVLPTDNNTTSIEVAVREKGTGIPIRIDRASSGWVEALTILMQLETSPPGSLICIEEPESHFHADSLRAMTGIIKRRAEKGLQIIVASHSLEVVSDNRFSVEQKVYFLYRDRGGPTQVQEIPREPSLGLLQEAMEHGVGPLSVAK